MAKDRIRSTTILCVRKGGKVALGGDGQVTLGDTVVKSGAKKIRPLQDGKVLVGFAGSTADAFSLLERFEGMLKKHQGHLQRASIELAKEWRTDKALRHLQCLMIVTDKESTLLLSGTGDVIEPEDGIVGIGSGGQYAAAAAKALLAHSNLNPGQIVTEALKIAGSICIYSNQNIVVEELQ